MIKYDKVFFLLSFGYLLGKDAITRACSTASKFLFERMSRWAMFPACLSGKCNHSHNHNQQVAKAAGTAMRILATIDAMIWRRRVRRRMMMMMILATACSGGYISSCTPRLGDEKAAEKWLQRTLHLVAWLQYQSRAASLESTCLPQVFEMALCSSAP